MATRPPAIPSALLLGASALALWLSCVGPAAAQPPEFDWLPKPPSLPAPTGQVIRVSAVEELFRAVEAVEPGGTSRLADGRYKIPRYL